MCNETVLQSETIAEQEDHLKTILIVDDDESQVAALEHRLQRQGYRVLTALTAARAKQLVLDNRPDLMLLDLRLPDQDGLTLCSQLADAPQTCGVPIIIVSAVERPDIVRRTRAVGGAYYLRKPYDPNVLLTLIHESLGHPEALGW
jgi:DNA-binding response OmpR family regulator